MAASTPVLHLLDTGNLVLLQGSTYIWQSFDYPTDTRLPGMAMVDSPEAGLDKHLTSSWKTPNDPSVGNFSYTIESHGLPQLSVFLRSEKRYRTGPWNGRFFTGLPLVTDRAFEAETVFNNGRLVSLSDPYNSSFHMRLTMNSSGLLQCYIMNEEKDGWILAFSIPGDTCDNYVWCGPNAVCKPTYTPVCECLNGFMPKSEKEWSVFAWTSGCSRVLPLDCVEEDGFMKFDRVKFPDTLSFRVDEGMTADECRQQCLRNCSCTAYADPYLNNERNGCLMWFGDLIDFKEFSGEVGTGQSIYIRVPKTELERMADRSKTKGHKKLVYIATAASVGMVVLILCFGGIILRIRRRRQACKKKREDLELHFFGSAAMAVLVLILAFGGIVIRTRCKRRACKKEREGLELPLFGLTTIAAATSNFSDKNLIGEGGFGPVYKGNVSAEVVIAVKRMSKTSGQGADEFKNEAILIAKLQHRNLVRIIGCCIEGEEKMLIYEYMQNKSLDHFIFDQNRSAMLDWPKRFDIIMGIARGLLYLHHDSRLKVIHGDLKTSNILLDESLNPKISDWFSKNV